MPRSMGKGYAKIAQGLLECMEEQKYRGVGSRDEAGSQDRLGTQKKVCEAIDDVLISVLSPCQYIWRGLLGRFQ